MNILLDMDGVLADFYGHWLKVAGRESLIKDWPLGEPSISKVASISLFEFWEITVLPDFWYDIPKLPWFDDLINLVRKFGIFTICSDPGPYPNAASQKIRWLKKYLGMRFDDYMLGPLKYLMAGNGILIDDSDENINAFKAHGGQAILFPACTNSNWPMTTDRLGYVREKLLLYSGRQCNACTRA